MKVQDKIRKSKQNKIEENDSSFDLQRVLWMQYLNEIYLHVFYGLSGLTGVTSTLKNDLKKQYQVVDFHIKFNYEMKRKPWFLCQF